MILVFAAADPQSVTHFNLAAFAPLESGGAVYTESVTPWIPLPA